MTMSDREEYVKKMKAKIDEWDAEIDKVSAKTEQAQADAKLKYQAQLEELRKQRDRGLEQLQEMQAASADAWESMRKGMEESWNSMNKAFKEALDRFK